MFHIPAHKNLTAKAAQFYPMELDELRREWEKHFPDPHPNDHSSNERYIFNRMNEEFEDEACREDC